MIAGFPIEYAHARASARLAQHPDERLWTQLHSARSVGAALDAVRGSAAAPYVSGVTWPAPLADLELAFRQQWRTRVDEVARWAPDAWPAALRWTAHLIDLPALVHLLGEESLPPWIGADPALSPYAHEERGERLAALAAGPLAPLALAVETAEPPPRRLDPAAWQRARLHAALRAWEREWRARWPACDDEARAGLERLVAVVRAHLIRFRALAVDDAPAARQRLATDVAALLRRSAAQPAALFAYLALVALDLERLRGEIVARAAFRATPEAAS
ncbi:hypothetical protein FBR04_12315 [Betaproteobacteria bacterium PRO7]|nr:hypothetical protein [Betaproteobacteria bacterium PRO7]